MHLIRLVLRKYRLLFVIAITTKFLIFITHHFTMRLVLIVFEISIFLSFIIGLLFLLLSIILILPLLPRKVLILLIPNIRPLKPFLHGINSFLLDMSFFFLLLTIHKYMPPDPKIKPGNLLHFPLQLGMSPQKLIRPPLRGLKPLLALAHFNSFPSQISPHHPLPLSQFPQSPRYKALLLGLGKDVAAWVDAGLAVTSSMNLWRLLVW